MTEQYLSVVQNAFEDMLNKISTKFGMSVDELKSALNDGAVNTAPKTVVSKKKIEKSDEKCPYVFAKGEKKGVKCGSNAPVGKTYCSKHSKYEPEEKKVDTETTDNTESSSEAEEKVVKVKVNSIKLGDKMGERVLLDKYVWNGELKKFDAIFEGNKVFSITENDFDPELADKFGKKIKNSFVFSEEKKLLRTHEEKKSMLDIDDE